MTTVRGQHFRDDTDAIKIRRDSCDGDQRAIARRLRNICQHPSGKKMCDWTHEVSVSIYQDVVAFYLYRINFHFGCRTVAGFPGRSVELPAVPRTNDLVAVDHALPQRPAAVQADVVHR